MRNNAVLKQSDEARQWHAYAQVYELMADVPFVREQRELHLRTLRELGGSSLEYVLDAGCANGLYTERLAGVAKKVAGIDRDTFMLDAAWQRLVGYTNVELYNGDVTALPFEDKQFNALVSNNILHFVKDEDKFFSEAARVLKKGGVLSLSSARKGTNVEVLVQAMLRHFAPMGIDQQTRHRIDEFVESNRTLSHALTHCLEPWEAAGKLRQYGFSRVVMQGESYLGQNFYVAALR